MNKRHKWADCIIAWAEGKEIQWRFTEGSFDKSWGESFYGCIPDFNHIHKEFRIKPHKHQHLIDAYVLGKTIQYKSQDGEWYDIARHHTTFNKIIYNNDLVFNDDIEYRVKHKYQDVIDAYLRGETVQYYCINPDWNSGWLNVVKGKSLDVFDSGHEFRIKPKPDITKTGRIYLDDANQLCWNEYNYPDNVKFTFDGETGKLKEVINLYE